MQMLHRFPFFPQRDAMDCGPACLMMVAASHGRNYALPYLRELCHLDREGVSARGIMDAAEHIGFRTLTVRVPFEAGKGEACLLSAPLPCVGHWNQNHFVVIYRVTKHTVWVADPGAGKVKLARAHFEKSWLGDTGQGILILFETTPDFFSHESEWPVPATGISRVLSYIKPHRRLLLQVLLGMLLGSMLALVFPFLTQSIIDYGIDNRSIDFIYLVLVAQIMLFTGQMTLQFLQNRILLYVGARINISMISDFLAKLMRLPIGYFDAKMTGDLMQRIGDQTRIEAFLTQSALPVMFSALNFIVFGLIIMMFNFSIFLIYYVAAFLYVLWIGFFLSRRKTIDYMRFQQSAENNNTLIEIVQGMQEIKLQGSEYKRRGIWYNVQARLFRTSMMALNLAQWQEAGAGFIYQGKNILITFIAAKSVIDGQMTLGMMMAIQYMIGQLDHPLQQMINFIRSGQDARISLDRMGEIQSQRDEDAEGRGFPGMTSNNEEWAPRHLTHKDNTAPGGILIDNLSFRYNPLSDYVLRDINLHIPVAKVTAIIGASGSGKTTLLKLLLAFYRPVEGRIKIGNISLEQLKPSEWRKQCSAVLQDGFVFSDTVINNITECDERPDWARLIHSVEVANIRDFIESLPLSYDTKIGATGNGISQGQRQRLLIARAVYKKTDFMFFDEATNALDANNERAIVENLQLYYRGMSSAERPGILHPNDRRPDVPGEYLPAGKTVVVVAHRLSTVRHADQIVVLERGRIVETGTHEELVKSRGNYYNLIKNQLELGI
jgi:ATP-binding cassette subfamily B protein